MDAGPHSRSIKVNSITKINIDAEESSIYTALKSGYPLP
jgi:hypothetical protein